MRLLTLSAALALFAGCNNEPPEEIGEEFVNSPPVAVAGNDIDTTADGGIDLDGSGSYDPDGHSIRFHWSFDRVPENSGIADAENPFPSNHTSTAKTKFTPDASGIYIVKLEVEDERGAMSEPDFVVVTVENGTSPIADAGTDQSGVEGDTFTLDGSRSYDPVGRSITYEWTLAQIPEGSTATLSASDTAMSSFTADAGGVYIAALVVDNGLGESAPDTTVIRVSSGDPQPPEALAGDDINTEDCSTVSLDGSGSYDANGDDLEYLWSLQKTPEASKASDSSIVDRTAATTSFYPDVAGTYTLSLAVYDGTAWSKPDLITLVADERSFNTPPVVNAGNPVTSDAGEASCEEDGYQYDCDSCSDLTVTLGGDASASDADGDPLTYLWEVISGDATILDPTAVTTEVKLEDAAPTEPAACEDTEYVFQLTTIDCVGDVVTDTVTFTATCCGVLDTGAK